MEASVAVNPQSIMLPAQLLEADGIHPMDHRSLTTSRIASTTADLAPHALTPVFPTFLAQ